jgi:hypothetical protein
MRTGDRASRLGSDRARKTKGRLTALLVLGAAIGVCARQDGHHGLAWAPGERYIYAFRWSTKDRVMLVDAAAAEPLTSRVNLAGELTLRCRATADGGAVLALSVLPTEEAVTALGRDLLGGVSLGGHEALLHVAPSGEIDQVLVAPGDPEAWKGIAQALAAELSLTRPAGATDWSATAHDTLGEVQMAYHARSAEHIDRRRASYTRLLAVPDLRDSQVRIDSRHEIALPGGFLGSLDEEDRVRVERAGGPALEHDGTLTLRLVRTVPDATPAAAPIALEARTPGVPVVSDDAVRALLERRADGMTGDDLLNDLYVNARGGLHDNHRWFWRATGLLELHPELSAELVPIFTDSETSAETRRVILDLLVGAGHAEAQRALRAALGSVEARSAADYGMLVQRMSLLPAPDADSVAFVADLRARALVDGDAELARATTFALGAAAGRLAERDAAAAAPYNRALVDALSSAATPEERATALGALGNAGRPENESLVLRAASDDDPGVRAAAATALRKSTDGAATQALLALAADPAPAASAAALTALRGRRLDDDELGVLEAELIAGRLGVPSHAALANLLAARLATEPAAALVLKELLARTPDVQLQARLRTLLGAQSG